MAFFKKMLVCLIGISSAACAGEKMLLDENTVVIRGEINERTVAEASAAILRSKSNDVNIVISSPGGSVLAGMHLMYLLKSTDKRTHCLATTAASMAFGILQACTERLVTEDSILMQHVPSYGVEGQEPNNFSFAGFIRKMRINLDKQQAARIGLSFKDFQSRTRDDWWLVGEEAVSEHVADKLANASCSPSLAEKVVNKEVSTMFFNAIVSYSACPLIDGPIAVKIDRLGQPITAESQKAVSQFVESLDIRQLVVQKRTKTED